MSARKHTTRTFTLVNRNRHVAQYKREGVDAKLSVPMSHWEGENLGPLMPETMEVRVPYGVKWVDNGPCLYTDGRGNAHYGVPPKRR